MDYRKRTFRGAKIEDCILDFENMRKTAEKQSRTTTDEFRKRLYDGMAISYQTVVNRLLNDFNYHLKKTQMKNPLQKWKEDFERMATSCLEQAINPNSLSSVPETIKNDANFPKQQKGLFEGMSTGYGVVVSQIEILLGLGDSQIEVEDAVKLMREQLTNKSNEITEVMKEDMDPYKRGFYSGIKSSYISAMTHMNL